MKPMYKHDCAHCVYLGTKKDNDHYFCEEGGLMAPTIIIRHSSDGSDYTSGICFAKHIPEIGDALKKAIEMGLISQKKADYLTKRKQ